MEGATTLKALDLNDVKGICQNKLLESGGFNKIADKDTFVPISTKTIKRYVKEIGAKEVKGKDQAENREEAFNDIRNAIAKAVGLTAMSKIVQFMHIHSTDEVGLFLFGWHQTSKRPKLVVTAEANEWLRKNNTSVSKSID
jgi:hypothetical protein